MEKTILVLLPRTVKEVKDWYKHYQETDQVWNSYVGGIDFDNLTKENILQIAFCKTLEVDDLKKKN